MSRRRSFVQPDTPAATGGDATGRETPSGPAGFVCAVCGGLVPEEATGTNNRNHCPHCLSSIHVDVRPGDRRSLCRGPMEAIAVWVDGKGEPRLIHRCTECGVLKSNRIAGDDDPAALRSLGERSRGGVIGAVYGTITQNSV